MQKKPNTSPLKTQQNRQTNKNAPLKAFSNFNFNLCYIRMKKGKASLPRHPNFTCFHK